VKLVVFGGGGLGLQYWIVAIRIVHGGLWELQQLG